MVRAPFRYFLAATAAFLASCTAPTPPAARSTAPPASPVRITQFYAAPAVPPKGQKTLICYGVENATEVQLDPPIEKVWPSLSHCFDLVPVKAVTYTLTALHGTERVSQSLTVKPGPPAVRLLEVSINQIEVAAGGSITVCFKAADAVNVTIRPGEWIPPHSFGVGCSGDRPRRSTTYTVTATGAAGDTVSQQVTAKVK